MTEKEFKSLTRFIMYDKIHQLHNEEHRSIRWIAEYLGVNFRTVKKYLEMDPADFQQYSESMNNRSCLLEPYKTFIVERLSQFQDTPAAQMHDWLKEHYPSFPNVAPKTVYNYVMKLRQEHNLPKIRINERQYECLPDTPPGKYAQVDFGTCKLRQGDGVRKRVHFWACCCATAGISSSGSRINLSPVRMQSMPMSSRSATFMESPGISSMTRMPFSSTMRTWETTE